jgi:bifunctional non-homologous end joining protein LigD
MLAKELARAEPRLFTVERVPQSRPDGTVYVDWGQMGRGMTIAAPFVPRACDGAPISMPLDWDEVESYARSRAKRPPIQEFRRYNIATAIDIVKAGGDPWRRTKRNRASAHLT